MEEEIGEVVEMTENQIAGMVVDSAYRIHVAIGPGLLESVYEITLTYELKKRGLSVKRQVPIRTSYFSSLRLSAFA